MENNDVGNTICYKKENKKYKEYFEVMQKNLQNSIDDKKDLF